MNIARTFVTLCAVVSASVLSASPAPVLQQVGFRSPTHAKVGQTLVVMASGLTADATFYFSDGTNPTIAATPVGVDTARGISTVRVPVGAKTGWMKVTASGVDSAPYWFAVDSGTFTQGTDVVTGQVSNGAVPVASAMMILLRPSGCDDMDIQDAAVTDVSGNYTLHGPDGNGYVMCWPVLSAGLANVMQPVTLSGTLTTLNVPLQTGTLVTGSVVDLTTPATPIPNAQVQFEGNAIEIVQTDASGNFSVHLNADTYKTTVTPPPGDRHAFLRTSTIVSGTPLSLSPFGLDGSGYTIHGVVRRASDGTPLTNARIDSSLPNSWDPSDRKTTAGDGSYVLHAAPNTTYHVSVGFGDDSWLVDPQSDVSVTTADKVQDFSAVGAAVISGRVTEDATGLPAAGNMSVQANQGSSSVAWANICSSNGTYWMRVAPSVTPYTVQTGWTQNGTYALQAWTGGLHGTPFMCEASPITLSSAGAQRSNVDFVLFAGGRLSGRMTDQGSGCTNTIPSTWVTIDDGSNHQCSLGQQDPNAPAGTWAMMGLPPSTSLASLTLRACTSANGYAPQCYNMKAPPDFTHIVLGAGGTASNIDFCLGNRPTAPLSNLRVTKSGGNIQFTWNASTDLYHDHYVLRGSTTARPSSGSGNFPFDPSFSQIGTSFSTTMYVPGETFSRFFLITDAGMTGTEGPSGSYGH